MYAYVGCRTTEKRHARGKGIRAFKIDSTTDDWKEIQTLKTLENPSYQCKNREGKFLYSVHGDFTEVTSYRIKPDYTLEYLNMVDTVEGRNPVYVTVDKTNRYVLAATLQGGRIFVIRRNADGSLGEIVFTHVAEGKTADSVSFTHQCIWDKTMTYLFAVYQGRGQGFGQVKVLKFDAESGTLTQTDEYKAPPIVEPRHLAVHPNNRAVYCINEKGNTMTYLEFDPEGGKLYPRQNLPTNPDTFTGEGFAGASEINEDGTVLIGSNRGHESYHVGDNRRLRSSSRTHESFNARRRSCPRAYA